MKCIKKNFSWPEIISLALFLLFLFLISKVNFMQNDDWILTSSVMRFLAGNFTLNAKTATTFYSQGFIGMFFSLIFGWKNLPFLTLFFSVINFYILARILIDHFNIKKLTASLISLILFFTPLYIYSVIGFMTENYTLFFILLSIYFFLNYEEKSSWKDLVLFDVSGILAFFSKQNGIIFQVASVPYFFLKKKYKQAFIQLGLLGVTFGYYYLFFPRTPEMRSKDFILKNLMDTRYSYSLVYEMLLVMTSYLLPVLVYFVASTYFNSKVNAKTTIILLATSLICYFLMNHYFEPGKIWNREYPYFQDTFERTGFLPRSLMGTKYQFMGNFKLYLIWDAVSKIFLSLSLPCLFFYRKKIINIYSIAICGYMLLMIFVKVFYDRYLLPLFPLIILSFLYMKPINKERLFYFVTVPFLIFTSFFSMELAIDFVVSNSYIWARSERLVQEQGVMPSQIRAGRAWGKLYDTTTYDLTYYQYLFSFDSPEKNPEMMQIFKEIEIKDVGFPGDIFINPKVYLYQKK